jgi:hypothetical protein
MQIHVARGSSRCDNRTLLCRRHERCGPPRLLQPPQPHRRARLRWLGQPGLRQSVRAYTRTRVRARFGGPPCSRAGPPSEAHPSSGLRELRRAEQQRSTMGRAPTGHGSCNPDVQHRCACANHQLQPTIGCSSKRGSRPPCSSTFSCWRKAAPSGPAAMVASELVVSDAELSASYFEGCCNIPRQPCFHPLAEHCSPPDSMRLCWSPPAGAC